MTSRHLPLLGSGLGLGVALILWYGVFGYHVLQIGLWLLSILLVGLYWAQFSPAQPPWDPTRLRWQQELLHLGLLVLVFAPIYLYDLPNIPFQINTDEIVITSMARRASGVRYPDIFGLMPEYFYFPRFMFSLFGGLTRLMGGVTLLNVRTVHAAFGVVTILVAYGFFRAFWGSRLALAGAALLGSNHALLGISRMAMRENLIVLVECAALALLLKGVREKNPLLLYLGGGAAAFSLYGYLPGRVVILLGLLFGVLYLLLGREDLRGENKQANPLWVLAKLTVPAALGFFSGGWAHSGGHGHSTCGERRVLSPTISLFPGRAGVTTDVGECGYARGGGLAQHLQRPQHVQRPRPARPRLHLSQLRPCFCGSLDGGFDLAGAGIRPLPPFQEAQPTPRLALYRQLPISLPAV
jgi:hypothetical protein